jgi:hypothetical protein
MQHAAFIEKSARKHIAKEKPDVKLPRMFAPTSRHFPQFRLR